MERHEIEDIRREAQDIEQTMKWEAFRPNAVEMIAECLRNDGDLVDLINDLDLNYDEYNSLTNSDINTLVIDAVIMVNTPNRKIKEIIDETIDFFDQHLKPIV